MTPQYNTKNSYTLTSRTSKNNHALQNTQTTPLKMGLSYHDFEEMQNEEDLIFADAQEAFEVLNDPDCLRVDGRSYQSIQESFVLREELESIRANAPIYQNWTNRRKQHFFDKLASEYTRKIQVEEIEQEDFKVLDSTVETVEGSQIEFSSADKPRRRAPRRITTRSHCKETARMSRPLFEVDEEIGQSSPKRVLFVHQSEVRYFGRMEPTEAVHVERQYAFSTFDRF